MIDVIWVGLESSASPAEPFQDSAARSLEVNSSGLSRLSNFISVRRSCGKIYHDDFLRKSRVSFLRSDHLWRPAQRRPTTREGKRNRRCVAATQMHALTMANRSLIPRRFRLRPFTAERQLHCGLDNGNTSSKAPKGRQAGFLVRAAFSRSFCVGQALYLESMHLQEKNVNPSDPTPFVSALPVMASDTLSANEPGEVSKQTAPASASSAGSENGDARTTVPRQPPGTANDSAGRPSVFVAAATSVQAIMRPLGGDASTVGRQPWLGRPAIPCLSFGGSTKNGFVYEQIIGFLNGCRSPSPPRALLQAAHAGAGAEGVAVGVNDLRYIKSEGPEVGLRAAQSLMRSAVGCRRPSPSSHLVANAATSVVLPLSPPSASSFFRILCQTLAPPYRRLDSFFRPPAALPAIMLSQRKTRWRTNGIARRLALAKRLLIALCPRVGARDTITASSRSYLFLLLILFLRVLFLS
ncbi:hypothetical protein C7M84_003958 [Penaeus vannamei]|uniref:Uncharacterized protein n=1 Tax=Penaeus vannamei TaxID=6689 RepID=A0A3R7PUG4_PENVA|nr:hypothetical protein C7M84_003958 [Penaeus vannamei]